MGMRAVRLLRIGTSYRMNRPQPPISNRRPKLLEIFRFHQRRRYYQ